MNAPDSLRLGEGGFEPVRTPDTPSCRLLLVSGSRRRDSYNSRLLRHLAHRLQSRCRVEVLDPALTDLPLFDQDLEVDSNVIERVAALHRRFETSHGLVVATPEYNGMPTPYLKNIVDWVSRLPHVDSSFANPFRERPLLLCSASTGWSGGAVAIPHVRALFGYLGCLVIGDAVCVPYAEQAWADGAYRFDPFFEAQIDAAADQLVRLATALNPACAHRAEAQ
jgi:chromate reductase, NAD(P)H dehydrogenase (quinone)